MTGNWEITLDRLDKYYIYLLLLGVISVQKRQETDTFYSMFKPIGS